jgi:hypothetical protein
LEREAAAAAATAVIESKQVMLAKQAATSHGGLSLIRSSLMKGEKETEGEAVTCSGHGDPSSSSVLGGREREKERRGLFPLAFCLAVGKERRYGPSKPACQQVPPLWSNVPLTKENQQL